MMIIFDDCSLSYLVRSCLNFGTYEVLLGTIEHKHLDHIPLICPTHGDALHIIGNDDFMTLLPCSFLHLSYPAYGHCKVSQQQ